MGGSHKPIVVADHHEDNDPIVSARVVLEAARDGDVEVLRSLPRDRVASAMCASGCRALHWAAGNNQLGAMRFLLDDETNNKNEGEGSDPPSTTTAPLFRPDDAASGPSRGRTPLHYACRNGCLEAAQVLIERYGANPNARAKQGVTPFQMAVWRNRIDVAVYLVERHHVNPHQLNDFHCNAAHWACLCPIERAGDDGERLMPLLQWLKEICGSDLFRYRQRQGHTAFHKACWLGHIDVVRWLHEECDLWDDQPDFAGNYGVDLCRMADTDRHRRLERYLRAWCSRQPVHWCRTLGLDYAAIQSMRTPAGGSGEASGLLCKGSDSSMIDSDEKVYKVLRAAYLARVRQVHPDAMRGAETADNEEEFHRVRDAYRHLLEGGLGGQGNPNHQLPLLLRDGPESPEHFGSDCGVVNETLSSLAADKSSFKSRLLVVLREYGDKGMNVSNLKKKWRQVWNAPFPESEQSGITLSRYVSTMAGDVVTIHKNSKTGQVHVRARGQTQQPPVAVTT